MSFKDKVAAGATLIKEALQSAGFVSGVTGWQVRRDGGAEFSSLLARGDVRVTTTETPPVNVSLIQLATDLRSNRTVMTANSGLAFTTTTNAVPGTTIIGTADLIRDFLSLDNGLQPTDQIAVVVRVDVDAQSSSATGSGGHMQMRYVRADGSYTDAYRLEYRNGANDGLFMASQSWKDTWLVSDFRNFLLTSGPTIKVRHTGTTAYIVQSVTVTVTTKVLR